MITKVFTATNIGLESQLIEVEVDILPAVPAISIVGLPDKAVQESKERIKSAIKQSGFEFPLGKVVINLAPAGVTKAGSSFDLPIALGVLAATGFVSTKISEKDLFVGELSLDGKLRSIKGVLTLCLWAKNNGYQRVFIPKLFQLLLVYGSQNEKRNFRKPNVVAKVVFRLNRCSFLLNLPKNSQQLLDRFFCQK